MAYAVAMPDLWDEFKRERRAAHERILNLVADLDDGQLAWRPGPHAPSIGFHLWHTGRWADYDREIIGGGRQIWEERDLAAAWALAGAELGPTGTGTGMGDDQSEVLVLPAKATLLAYVKDAFAAHDAFLDQLTPAQLGQPTRPPGVNRGSIQRALFNHVAHDNRHLGMIEALRGLLGLRGTATA
jgi:uncharacterized damage-inducible protein DinB